MRLNRIGSFAIGVMVTAVSVGAVSIVNASGDATIKACANKATGVLRYLSKGSCAKTETALSWNQVGPQGAQGPAGVTAQAGATGERGPSGPKGDTGAPGSAVRYSLVDANNVSMGALLGVYSNEYTVLYNGNIWGIQIQSGWPQGTSDGAGSYYKDASCSIPYGAEGGGGLPLGNQSSTFIDQRTLVPLSSDKAYKEQGAPIPFTGTTVYQRGVSCTALSDATKSTKDSQGYRLFDAVEVAKPPLPVTPMSIVEQ
jgi:hypothetical protein